MDALKNIQAWSATHHPRWLVILRVALGLLLFAKGIEFIKNTSLLDRLLSNSPLGSNSGWLQILIAWANLLGGFMLIVGLWTRLVSLLQVPILIGAIVFINTQKGGFGAESELALAFFALLLAIFFLIEGGGPLSLDTYFQKNQGKNSQGRTLP